MDRTGIADACICLDLAHGRLLPLLRQFGLRWVLPDVVAAELRNPSAEDFLAAGMVLETATPAEVEQVARLRARYRKPSTSDLFALAMALKRSAILLTGDRSLKLAADQEGVEARGMLWLLDQLESTVDIRRLAAALEAVLAAGAYLPDEECRRRLVRWRGKR